MFTITDKQDMDVLNKYNAEITRWRSHTTRNVYFRARDWNGYEALGREIEQRWRVVFAEMTEKQKLREIEEDVAETLIKLSISKKKNPIIKQAGPRPPTRRSSRIAAKSVAGKILEK